MITSRSVEASILPASFSAMQVYLPSSSLFNLYPIRCPVSSSIFQPSLSVASRFSQSTQVYLLWTANYYCYLTGILTSYWIQFYNEKMTIELKSRWGIQLMVFVLYSYTCIHVKTNHFNGTTLTVLLLFTFCVPYFVKRHNCIYFLLITCLLQFIMWTR